MSIHEIIWRYIKVISTHLIILAFAGVFVYKFTGIALGLKAEGLTTTDLLAILLAFFSISLAVFFYFKSTEESNRFYANSYEFTKAMSEMLGRIEAGFGERLRHIDEGYTHISQRFDDVVADRDKTVKKVEKKVEREQEDVEKLVQEKQKMIQSLLAKTDLQEAEKKSISGALLQKDKELQDAQAQLARYQHVLRHELAHMPPMEISSTLRRLFLLLGENLAPHHFVYDPFSTLRDLLRPLINRLSESDRLHLRRYRVVDRDFELTPEGWELLKRFWGPKMGKPMER